MKKTMLMLYHSLFLGHVRYCISSWYFGNETLIDKLQRLCNKFIKIIFNLSDKENVSRTMSKPGLRTRSIFNRVQVRVRVHKKNCKSEFEFEFFKFQLFEFEFEFEFEFTKKIASSSSSFVLTI